MASSRLPHKVLQETAPLNDGNEDETCGKVSRQAPVGQAGANKVALPAPQPAVDRKR